MSAPVLFGPNNRATNLQNGFLNSDGSTVKNDGLINYIQNPGFENGTTNGWTLSKVTLTNNFPSAPSGSISAGVTFVPYQTTVLSGNYSGAFISTTSFVAGDSLVSSTMTIDPKYQSQVLSFSFSYKVDAGASLGVFAGNNTNTFGIAIYDVTNATFVQPSSGLWSISGYAGTAAGQFQTASNGSQYQLAIFANTGVTGAFRFLVDDFFFGASVPAGNDGRVLCTTVNYAGQALGAGALTKFATPTVVIDTTSSFDTTAKRWNCPAAGFYCLVFSATNAGGTSSQLSSVLYVNGASVDESDGIANATTQTAANTTVLSLKSGDYVELYGFTQSAATLSGKLRIFRLAGPTSGDEGRVISFYGTNTAGTAIGTSPTQVPFVVASDTAGGWATNQYTIPTSGVYDFAVALQVNSPTLTTSQAFFAQIFKNGSAFTQVGQAIGNGTANFYAINAPLNGVPLVAGDVITLRAQCSVATTLNGGNNYFSISRRSGPNAVSAQETVALRYSNTAGTSLPAATVTSVPFAVKDYDTNSLYNGTTATIQSAGKYRITCGIITAATTLATTGTVSSQVYKNGSFNTIIGGASGNGAAVTRAVNGTTTLNLVAGDTIDLRVYTDSATTLLTTSGYNYFEIQKVGN